MGGRFQPLRDQPLTLACTYVSSATVTPSGVRDGDPAALSALCAVRGPSVLAYCRHVAGEAEAGAAAADAFARFRVAVVAADDTTSLNPEALLISATRTSAAARVGSPAPGDCAEVPAMLAARADRTISVADLERVESHLEQCWACRAPVARFQAAERAYRDPPEKTIDPALTGQIVDALIAAVPAAPAAGLAGTAAAANTPSADPHATQAFAVEQPTEHFSAPGMIDPDLASEADAGAAPAEPPLRRSRGSRRSPRSKREGGAAALLTRLRPGSSARTARERSPAPEPAAPAAAAATPPDATAAPPARARRGRARPARPARRAVVLPLILVLLALLGALVVSGVLGGDDPASSSGVTAPAADPGETAAPEVVVVPGAKDASADAVETAKARERARGRGDATPAKKAAAKPEEADAPAASTPPPAVASTPPAAPAAPRVSAEEPATKRPPPAGSGAQKQIDAGGGAVGAEQIPPATDTSDVPDLAPPP